MKAFPFSSFLVLVLSNALVMTPLWAQSSPSSSVAVNPEPEVLQIRVLNAESLQNSARTGIKQSVDIQVTDATGVAVPSAAVTCRLPETGATGTFDDGTHAAVAYTDAQGRATISALEWGQVTGSVAMRVTASKGTTHTGILLETTLKATDTPTTHQPAAEASAPKSVETTVVPVPIPDPQPAVAAPAVTVKQPGQLAPVTPAAPAVVDPSVTVSKPSAADAPHSSHAKWIVLALIGIGAAAGAGFAMKGKSSSSSTTPTASISIGTPTVSVGGSH